MSEPATAREEWRPVVGYEGRYEVSDQGRVRAVARVTQRIVKGLPVKHTIKPCVLRPCTKSGHYYVALRDGKRPKTLAVHALVLEAFVGLRPPGMVCCHGTGGALDNRPTNLRWDTQAENNRDLVRHGTHHYSRRTHCMHGHEYTPQNTTWRNKGQSRCCRTCDRASAARLREQRRSA